MRVILADYNSKLILFLLTHLPRLMDMTHRYFLKLWAPSLDVKPHLVMVLRLFDLIEVEHLPRAHATCGVPSTSIRMNIVVNQGFFEMISTLPPVLL